MQAHLNMHRIFDYGRMLTMNDETVFEKALKDPASVYHSPFEVLNDRTLNDKQRLAILQSWEQDERELDVAQEEGMAGGEKSILGDILTAIDRLDIPASVPASPTKHGSHSN